MKRSLFINSNKPIPRPMDIFTHMSLWWNKEWKSGPWYLRQTPLMNNPDAWIMGVDDGVMRKRKVVKKYRAEFTGQWIEEEGEEIGCGGGRPYDSMNEATKKKILAEFEPYTNQRQK